MEHPIISNSSHHSALPPRDSPECPPKDRELPNRTMVIRPILEGEIEDAKRVVRTSWIEFFGKAPVHFEDMDEFQAYYSEPAGTFLVLVDNGRIAGTGAVGRLDGSTCELRRMWFLKEYRGLGFGKKMAQMLLDRARELGYERVRLETDAPLEQAVALYRRLGFEQIERYNDGPSTMFMEKAL